MSKLSTSPVVRCRKCGRPLEVSHLEAYGSDPEGENLFRSLRNLAKSALCGFCQRRRNYYASVGRVDDWERGLP